ncbi:hypothetical protein OC844_007381 [Tilletia horrida]|nr:hypothetical protein OC844_007381 [Tilletia horrida]
MGPPPSVPVDRFYQGTVRPTSPSAQESVAEPHHRARALASLGRVRPRATQSPRPNSARASSPSGGALRTATSRPTSSRLRVFDPSKPRPLIGTPIVPISWPSADASGRAIVSVPAAGGAAQCDPVLVSLHTQITALKVDNAALREELSALKRNGGPAQDVSDAIQRNMAALQRDRSALEQGKASSDALCDELRLKIRALEQDNANLEKVWASRYDELQGELAALRQEYETLKQGSEVRCKSLQEQVDHLVKERFESEGVRRQLVVDIVDLKTRVFELSESTAKPRPASSESLSASSTTRSPAKLNPPASSHAPGSSTALSSDPRLVGDDPNVRSGATGPRLVGDGPNVRSEARNCSAAHAGARVPLTTRASRYEADPRIGVAVAYEIHGFAQGTTEGGTRAGDGAGCDTDVRGGRSADGVGLFYAPVFESERGPTIEPPDTSSSMLGSPRWIAPTTAASRYFRARALARRLTAPDLFDRDRSAMLNLLRRFAPDAPVEPFLALVNEKCVDHYEDLADVGDRLVRNFRRVTELTDFVYQLETKLVLESERTVSLSERLLHTTKALRRAQRQGPRHLHDQFHDQFFPSSEADDVRIQVELDLQKDLTKIAVRRLSRLSMLVMENGRYKLERGYAVPLLPEGAGLRSHVVQATAGRLVAVPEDVAVVENAYTTSILADSVEAEAQRAEGRVYAYDMPALDEEDVDGIYEHLRGFPSPPLFNGPLASSSSIDAFYSLLLRRSAGRRRGAILFDPSDSGEQAGDINGTGGSCLGLEIGGRLGPFPTVGYYTRYDQPMDS